MPTYYGNFISFFINLFYLVYFLRRYSVADKLYIYIKHTYDNLAANSENCKKKHKFKINVKILIIDDTLTPRQSHQPSTFIRLK